jgi:hypothetical protein
MKSWTVDWTAPNTDEGEITFYAAFNAANGNGGTSGDVIYKSMASYEQSTIGIGDEIAASSVILFPNPAMNFLNIDFPGSLTSSEISLYNTSGQIVGKYRTEGNMKLDISDLEQGFYFMHIESGDRRIIKKFIKQ